MIVWYVASVPLWIMGALSIISGIAWIIDKSDRPPGDKTINAAFGFFICVVTWAVAAEFCSFKF